jgi:hypothetical protein
VSAADGWRTVILDVLHHYKGAFTWRELWEDTSGSEIQRIHDRAVEQAKAEQSTLAFQALMLARNPMIGGHKDLEIDDLYTGLARHDLSVAPYSPAVMRGIQLAIDLHASTGRLVLSQAHVDLLDGQKLARYFKQQSGRPGARERLANLRKRTGKGRARA